MNMPLRKRLFDLSLAVITIPVWVPVFVGCVLLLWISEGRPIFYTSSRRVQGVRRALTWKFRVMVRDAARIYNRDTVPVAGQRFLNVPPDSPLYTPVGRFIEKCQFTELPQVFQVFSGTLSIVGNRPLPENVISTLREAFPDAEARFDSPCGLTGIVQLIGRDFLPDADRLALESRYCRTVMRRYSAWMDFLILAYTVLIHTRLMKSFSTDEAHRFLDRFAPRPSLPAVSKAPAGADDFHPLTERRLP